MLLEVRLALLWLGACMGLLMVLLFKLALPLLRALRLLWGVRPLVLLLLPLALLLWLVAAAATACHATAPLIVAAHKCVAMVAIASARPHGKRAQACATPNLEKRNWG